MTIHPKVEPQPVCADRLTLSRERIGRLIDKATTERDDPLFGKMIEDYAQGVIDALEYLLNPDHVPLSLASTIGVSATGGAR